MEWTRRPWARLLATAAALVLVVRHADDRGGFFWLGVVLLGLNLVGWLAARGRPGPPGNGPEVVERPERRVSELLHLPAVAEAVAAAPARWEQVSFPEEHHGHAALLDLLPHLWVQPDGGDWVLAVDDELKPYLDLDVDPDADPVVVLLQAHPSLGTTWHEDREVYRVEARTVLRHDEFAALAVRALAAHHRDAVARLGR